MPAEPDIQERRFMKTGDSPPPPRPFGEGEETQTVLLAQEGNKG